MRSLVALAAVSLLIAWALPAGQDAAAPQANVTITPRPRPKGPEPETVVDRQANIRVDTTLVLIPTTVMDPLGRFVAGLDKENFKLLENGVEQQISQFSSEDAPLSVGIVFDTSGSMGDNLRLSRLAVARFLNIANPQDEFFLVQFNDRPKMVVPFTTDPAEIQNPLLYTTSKGRTALLDGVYMALNAMKKAHNPRKAILIISDGDDNSSRYTPSEVSNAIREADVQIYGIGIFMTGMLHQLAEYTGGRSFEVHALRELPDVAEKIATELRNQYVLGYRPKIETRDGKYRRVQVKLTKVVGLPSLKATFRTGYYAPLD